MGIIRYLGQGSGFLVLLLAVLFVFGVVVFATLRSSRRHHAGRILFPVFFLGLSLVFLILLLNFPVKKQTGIGAGVVPLLWIVGISAFSVLLLVRALLNREAKDPEWGHVGTVFVYLGWTILYLILMQYLGYFISTVLFLLGGMYYLNYRNWKVMIGLAAGWLLFSYFAFYRLLFVPLPAGTLLERFFG